MKEDSYHAVGMIAAGICGVCLVGMAVTSVFIVIDLVGRLL
jgi:hypothetical protein